MGKTRHRRVIRLEDRPAALLAALPLKTCPVSPSLMSLRRFRRECRPALGLERFPKDLLRHTAASYLLALHQGW